MSAPDFLGLVPLAQRVRSADDKPRADVLIRPEGAYRLVQWRGKDWLQHAAIDLDGTFGEDDWTDVAWDCIDDEQKEQAAYAARQLGLAL